MEKQWHKTRKMGIQLFLMIGIWAGCFAPVLLLHGQTPAQEFKKLLDFAQREGTNIEYKLQYAYYERGAKIPSDTMSVSLVQNGSSYRMKGPDFEWIQEGAQLLYVDHQNREMVLQNTQKGNRHSPSLGEIQLLINKQGYELSALRTKNGMNTLRIAHPQDPGSRIEITYETRHYTLTRAVIYQENPDDPQENVKLVVSYSVPVAKPGKFPWPLASYFRQEGKVYRKTKPFEQYSIQAI
jgi:hypothetical protein